MGTTGRAPPAPPSLAPRQGCFAPAGMLLPAAFPGGCAGLWERLRPLPCCSSGLTWCNSTRKRLRLGICGVAGDQRDRTAHLRVGKRLSRKEFTLIQKNPRRRGRGRRGKAFLKPQKSIGGSLHTEQSLTLMQMK